MICQAVYIAAVKPVMSLKKLTFGNPFMQT
ncbi:MAG: hypothetical protein RLY31_1461 [Bacteroidota bacterium]|jgi:hypothetical protein